jgi:hypothetical protein
MHAHPRNVAPYAGATVSLGTAHVNLRTVGATAGAEQQLSEPGSGQAGSRRARWVFVVTSLLLLAISWYPFRLELPAFEVRGVETLPDGSLRFEDDQFASTRRPPGWLADALGSGSLAVSLQVRPSTVDQQGPARILALSESPLGATQDVTEHSLVIGQSGPDLVLRAVRPGTDRQGRPEIVVAGVLTAEQWHDIDLQLDDDLRLVVDGELQVLEPGIAGWAPAWDPDHRLSLGNTLSGTRPWTGTISRVQVSTGSEQVDVLASDELDVPSVRRRLPPRLREASLRVGAEPLAIGLLHVLLGGALGAAVVLARPGRRFAGNLWVVPALAAVANLGKVVIATRHPSIATFLLQSAGGGLGAMAAFAAVQRRHLGAGPTEA